eukprot:TRINITY_DN1399_c0_g1_i1.p1 TRINITY_DN1399_c0_g1~~TRINITY_DN1399_c0_g1_i1.p1  ORF type:complete len:392 (-),score=52.35 TRINITY_DN1399_c0_g1_i1:68-1243(-)
MGEHEEDHENLTRGQIITYSMVSLGLVCTAGLMSGLTIGLMSLDQMNLQILSHSGDATQKKYANRILPVVKNHHHLMVTLLLCNAAAMEALPIFLDKLTSPVLAIIISVTAVLFFGEIIPQALCVRYSLAIGAYTSWLVRGLMLITFPISWTIGWVLDRLLGTDHGIMYKRSELKELVTMHANINQGPLSIDECTIINGALDLKTKFVKDCMTPLDSVFMVSKDEIFDHEMIKKIMADGRSRVPVYKDNRRNIIGLLMVKYLIGVSPDKGTPISQVGLRPLPGVLSDKPLYDILNEFQTGKSHMCTVSDSSSGELIGIITLEDVIEELIQEEITDETDAMPTEEKLSRFKKHNRNIAHSSPEASRRIGVGQHHPFKAIETHSLLSSSNDNV